ncbi:MAG: hypothetical protein L0Z70_13515 [Chloroflexi bacterium]|nr:hypothetical protein [Chloroflexota bacterium]
MAQKARGDGNEGMARVCARRAAGIVAGEYFLRLGIAFTDPSAYERLKYLTHLEQTSPEVRQIASHFLARVSTDWTLPLDADLLQEARWLAEQLL